MKDLKFVCCQPAIFYYAWQIDVMLHNFLENGVKPENIHIVSAVYPDFPKEWIDLVNKYKGVKFSFYPDQRKDRSYIPSIYFFLMKKHMEAYPELQDANLFLHDCDIIFTRPVDFSSMLEDDVWYLSDTVGYIGTQYILTKGEDVYLDMCRVMDIDPEIPKQRNADSGGAQYLIKKSTPEFWQKVEDDSVKLYKHFCDTEKDYKGEGYPIQKWTAGMWSFLWNIWKFGYQTKVDKRLDFCWTTDPISKIETHPILHNAGVTGPVMNGVNYFYKGKYHKGENPFTDPHLDVVLNDEKAKTKCTWYYVNELIKLKK